MACRQMSSHPLTHVQTKCLCAQSVLNPLVSSAIRSVSIGWLSGWSELRMVSSDVVTEICPYFFFSSIERKYGTSFSRPVLPRLRIFYHSWDEKKHKYPSHTFACAYPRRKRAVSSLGGKALQIWQNAHCKRIRYFHGRAYLKENFCHCPITRA